VYDRLVVPMPIPELPYDVIAVRSPAPCALSCPGAVLIEHLACTRRNDQLERPAGDAVRLFWRFVIEQYGIYPRRQPGTGMVRRLLDRPMYGDTRSH